MILNLDKIKKKKKDLLQYELEQCHLSCEKTAKRIDLKNANNISITDSDIQALISSIQQMQKEGDEIIRKSSHYN